MEKIIVGNWKMNPSNQKDALHLFDAVKKGIKKAKNVDVVICPPFVYLSQLKGLTLGAQNVFYKESGAFTGEISAAQLKDLKVEYVIIGHSERRKYFAETNQIINQKIHKAIDSNLKVIFCVGENSNEDIKMTLEKQIKEVLIHYDAEYLQDISIAYEPVWAIGTGNNCSIEKTKTAVSIIRNTIESLYDVKSAKNAKILYGGSVNSQNSGDYIKQANVDGLLVGGASLNAEEFIKIVLSASI